MPSLIDTFMSSAHSLNTYETAMSVVGNNTSNAATPGYAKQDPVFVADAFTPTSGGGGVSLSGTTSTRNPYAEQTVQNAQSAVQYSSALATTLQNVEGVFPLPSSTSPNSGGLAGMMNQFFAAASSLTTNPNDTADRQAVINAAGNVATSFQETFTALTAIQSNAANQGKDTVQAINALVSQIQQINLTKQHNAAALSDPGLDAQLNASLESLAQLANITSRTASDGTTSVFLGGQTPLLMGVEQYSLSSSSTNNQLQVLDTTGKDVTSFATSGKLAAQVQLANTLVPGYVTQLNKLAAGFAGSINSTLAGGLDANGNAGAPLFTYNSVSPAHTLAITSLQPSQLAAASASGPGGNGNALALAGLDQQAQTSLNGFTFTGFYGNLCSVAGTDSANAQNNQTTAQQVLTQAQTLRTNGSGVSLDEEATRLTQYQQAYQATSKLITVMDQMIQTVLNMIPSN